MPYDAAKHSTSEKWTCDGCNWVYDEAIGDPERGTPAVADFATLPDDWICPSCGGMPKEFFKKIVERS